VKAIDDVKLYKEVMDSANVLDMKSDFVDIVGVLSSVLHLGNI
jgi:myosin heavy subunit